MQEEEEEEEEAPVFAGSATRANCFNGDTRHYYHEADYVDDDDGR